MTDNQNSLKPLREFDYSLIAKKIDGLHFNVNRDLEREISNAFVSGHLQHARSLSVLIVMLIRLEFVRNCEVRQRGYAT
jgi:hypothetical protein